MTAVDVISKKRHGQSLSESEIEYFVSGVVSGEFEDYQISAMLMAICAMGMDPRETLALTRAMARSGDMLDLSDIDGVKVDKHSSGGVGDTTSLILVPLLAACGAKVAKMSGRGLGFTGGTLDKLESIRGLSVTKSVEDFKEQVRKTGCAIVGQSANLAPADKTLYALRDVTATVDSNPLIVSSILSKKLAAGCDVVVLDVKYGDSIGRSEKDAYELADMMVQIGCMSGKVYSALVTSMNEPLGDYIGNALEVEEAIHVLMGKKECRLKTVALALGARILFCAKLVPSIEDGLRSLEAKITNGEGLAKFAEMVAAQGGDPAVIYDPSLLPKAKKVVPVTAQEEGYITKIATSDIGEACRMLGAGRIRKSDVIDPAVGLIMKKHIGDSVKIGDTLCEVHLDPSKDNSEALAVLNSAFRVGPEKPTPPVLIKYTLEPHEY